MRNLGIAQDALKHDGWKDIAAGLNLGVDSQQPYCPQFLRLSHALAMAVSALDRDAFDSLMTLAQEPTCDPPTTPKRKVSESEPSDPIGTRERYVIKVPNPKRHKETGLTPVFGPQPAKGSISPRSHV